MPLPILIPCGGDTGQHQDTGEDEDDIESQNGGEQHFAEGDDAGDLVIVDIVA